MASLPRLRRRLVASAAQHQDDELARAALRNLRPRDVAAVFDNAHDFGGACSDCQMAAPIAAFLAGERRRRLDLRRLLQGFVGDAAAAVCNCEKAGSVGPRLSGLNRFAVPPRVAGAALQIVKWRVSVGLFVLHQRISRTTSRRRAILAYPCVGPLLSGSRSSSTLPVPRKPHHAPRWRPFPARPRRSASLRPGSTVQSTSRR